MRKKEQIDLMLEAGEANMANAKADSSGELPAGVVNVVQGLPCRFDRFGVHSGAL